MNTTEQAMLGVVEETFASMAFMFPVEADPSAPQAPGAMDRVVVEFSGPFRGSLLLSASSGMLEPLAANMLGLDEGISPSPEQQQDAFKELLNVICGNLLPAIASPREVFDVFEPCMVAPQPDDPPPLGLRDLGTLNLDLDAGHVRLMLRVENLPTAAMTASKGAPA